MRTICSGLAAIGFRLCKVLARSDLFIYFMSNSFIAPPLCKLLFALFHTESIQFFMHRQCGKKSVSEVRINELKINNGFVDIFANIFVFWGCNLLLLFRFALFSVTFGRRRKKIHVVIYFLEICSVYVAFVQAVQKFYSNMTYLKERRKVKRTILKVDRVCLAEFETNATHFLLANSCFSDSDGM